MALSQTESQYSSKGRTKDMYIFSKYFLLTLNLSVRGRFSRAQAFEVIVCIYSDHVHVVESVSPRCLCVPVSVSMVLFMSNGGWCGRCSLRENTMDSVFPVLSTALPKHHANGDTSMVTEIVNLCPIV